MSQSFLFSFTEQDHFPALCHFAVTFKLSCLPVAKSEFAKFVQNFDRCVSFHCLPVFQFVLDTFLRKTLRKILEHLDVKPDSCTLKIVCNTT